MISGNSKVTGRARKGGEDGRDLRETVIGKELRGRKFVNVKKRGKRYFPEVTERERFRRPSC